MNVRSLSRRERLVMLAAGVLVLAWFLEHYALSPMLQEQDRLDIRLRALAGQRQRGESLLAQQAALASRWREMKAAMPDSPGRAESTVLEIVRSAAVESQFKLTLFKTDSPPGKPRLPMLAFHAAGTGSMNAVTGFLWRLESAAVPLRLGEVQVTTRKEATDDLSLEVRLSTLWMAQPAATTRPSGAAQRGADAPTAAGAALAQPGPSQGGRPSNDQAAGQGDDRADGSRTVQAAASFPLVAERSSLIPASRLEDYDALSQQNMFLKDRRAKTPARSVTPFQVTSRYDPPAPALVLTGVVWQGAEWAAFFEDAASGKVQRVSQGQPLADGIAIAADVSAVDILRDGRLIRISAGQDLTGAAARLGSNRQTPTSAGAGAAGAPPGPVTPGTATAPSSPTPSGGDSIIERMRLNRLQELNK